MAAGYALADLLTTEFSMRSITRLCAASASMVLLVAGSHGANTGSALTIPINYGHTGFVDPARSGDLSLIRLSPDVLCASPIDQQGE